MKILRSLTLVVAACVTVAATNATPANAKGVQTKPNFQLRDADGVVRQLSDYRGKWVVLEWVNFACPSVTAMYQAPTRKIPALQQRYRANGVVWLSINSNAAGTRGAMDPRHAKTLLAKFGAQPTALLFDPTGAVGKMYGAHVTPEVRVINPRGDVAYAGGIESSGTPTTIPYLDQVLQAAVARRALPFTAKASQGCRINYANATAAASPKTSGPKAPGFTLKDTNGVVRRLSDYRGKWVILEWVNYDCPFVHKHYAPSHRNMQSLQARASRAGIVWLSICSSSPGKQGYFSPSVANSRMRGLGATPSAYLLDPRGTVGRAYGARTTPGMRVISPQGTIEYSGGIDSIRSARASDVLRAKNYIALAIADIVARRPIAIKSSQSYGCSVKY